MKFIVDTQLPPALVRFLKTKGFDAIHPTHFPVGHLLDDERIREIAIAGDRIIVSKDSDFFNSYLVQGIPPKILLLKLGNTKNRDLLTMFDVQLPLIIQLFESGAGLVQFFPGNVVKF